MIEAVVDLILSRSGQISDNFGVNPLVFGLLYFGTVPLFWVSVYYTARNYARSKPLVLPVAGLLISQLACYTYLFASGENLPWWVYLLVLALLAAGAVKGVRQVRRKAQIQVQKVIHQDGLD